MISLNLLVVQFLLKVDFCVLLGRCFFGVAVCSFGALPLEASCSWIRIWLLGCCCSKELGVQMLRVDEVVIGAPLAVLTALLLAGACPSQLILLRNSRIVVVVRIVQACGCLVEGWCVHRSIQVVVMHVVLVACFDLLVFELVRFVLLFRLLCL